jgi:hypothetical protein
MPIEQSEAEIISAWQMLTRRMGAVCRPQIFDGELPPAAFGNWLDKWVLGGPTEQLALVVFPQFRDEIHKDRRGCSSDTTSRDLTKPEG